jgi:hypothetical protein
VHVVKSFILCVLIKKEGTGKSTKSKGGLEGSIPHPVGGWVCYSLVSEILVETSGWVYWSESRGYRLNSDCGIEKLWRNGVVESM